MRRLKFIFLFQTKDALKYLQLLKQNLFQSIVIQKKPSDDLVRAFPK